MTSIGKEIVVADSTSIRHDELSSNESEVYFDCYSNPMALPHHAETVVSVNMEDLHTEADCCPDSPYYRPQTLHSHINNNLEVSDYSSRANVVVERMLEYMDSTSSTQTYLRYVMAFVNSMSGEKITSEVVYRTLVTELGPQRVMLLSKELFEDPTPLRQRIKKLSVWYHPVRVREAKPTEAGHAKAASPVLRGTILVSGGDGTISFIMDQLQLVGKELEQEFDLGAGKSLSQHPADDAAATCDREKDDQGKISGENAVADSNLCYPFRRDLFVLPAIAVIPLGTGNDFSNCVGFGPGVELSDVSFCCQNCDASVLALMLEALNTECIPFDRWLVEFVPLRLAQTCLKRTPPAVQDNVENASENDNAMNRVGGSAPLGSLGAGEILANRHSSLPILNANGHGNGSNFANLVHHIDWERVRKDKDYKSRNITNYFGLGFDSYVTYQFDRFRRNYPKFCSTRVRNKVVYCAMGIKAGAKCGTLRRSVPVVCVPAPQAPPTVGGAPEMVALKIPKHTKALVISNVSSYSGGTRPWATNRGSLYYRPIEMDENNNVNDAANAADRTPDVTPVKVNDRKFEMQAMGGAFDYGALSVGVTSATKIIQSNEAFIFFQCTPNDLRHNDLPLQGDALMHSSSNYDSTKGNTKKPAKPWVQVDGEVALQLTEPTIVHIQQIHEARVYVRCRNPSQLPKPAELPIG